MLKKLDIRCNEDGSSLVLEEVFALIAHQWRQPLSEINSIVGNIDNRLYELQQEDPQITELLLRIESITQQMSKSIDEHRGYFHKKEIPNSCQKMLGDLVKSIEEHLAEKGISFSWSLDTSVEFTGDVELLKQIIVTLIDNARDALISRNVYKPIIKLTLEQDIHFFLIKICDNGGGISKSIMQKIFEPDFTTKHNSEGTGLGLFMAKKLLDEKFNASLVASNVENGVCFSIEIPKDKNNE
jgi:signal transduction histidine kinase